MLTSSEILREYAKCVIDPIYGIENYLETFDKTQEGFVPFKLFPKQKEIILSYEKHRFNIVTKPRQAGVSTTTAAYLSIKVGTADKDNPENILIIANKQELAFEFLSKIKDFLKQLPRWFWGEEYYTNGKDTDKSIFINESKKELRLPNNSRIKAVATSKDALRGFTPTFLVMDEAAYIDNGAEVFGAALTALGTGGRATLISCVVDNTFVFTDKGIKQVKDFIDKTKTDGYIVDSYNVLGYDRTRMSNLIFNNGLQETIKLETTSSKLESTKTHLIWGYSNEYKKFGYYNADKLKIGDYVNIQYGYNIWGSNDEIKYKHIFSSKENKPKIIYNQITPDLAYLIGLYLAEGSCYKKYNDKNELIGTNITITCGDNISSAIKKAGFNYSSHDNLHYTISSKYLGGLFESLGIDFTLKAKEKYIPSRLLEMSKENIIALIQGIMDGDGYSDKSRLRIGINLSSEKFIEQIRMILINFGILTDYQTGITPLTKKVKVESVYHRISATGVNAIKYYDLIGFKFERKQIKKQILNDNFRLTQTDFIPNGKIIIREIINKYNLTKRFKNTGLKVNSLRINKTNKTSDLNSTTFRKFIEYFENNLKLDLSDFNIHKILLDKGKWERIKSIEYSEDYTYDFSLPHMIDDCWTNSIVYNGVLGHQTPNGMDALYYKTYDQAKTKKNNFNIIEMKWYQDLRYNKDLRWLKDDKIVNETEFTFESYDRMLDDGWKPTSTWYEQMCMGMNNDAKMIAQELDVSFIGSGGNVIDEQYIDYHEKHNVMSPKITLGLEGEIWIWAEPQIGHQYILSSDVSRGDGEDSSTIIIIDFTTMEQVFEYQGKIQPDLLAQLIEEWGLKYNAYTVVDVTGGMGVSTVLKLLEFNYKLLHYDNLNGKILSSRQKELTSDNKKDKIPGFHATSVRLPMISNLEYQIRTNNIKIRSTRLISELKTFIYKNGRPDHMDGYHDDILMSLAMALWVLEHSFKNLEKLEKQTKAILSAWTVASNTTQNNKMNTTTYSRPNNMINNPSSNPYINYSWLFGK